MPVLRETNHEGVGVAGLTENEILRSMLDERGVEWKEHRHVMPGSMTIQRETLWGQPTDVASGKPIPHVYHYRATEMGDGRLFLEAQLITPEQAIAATLGAAITGETSDGYHTFNELYHHRAILFSVIVRDHKELAWKSKAHNDGTMYDGMFIVGIETPQGQATYHYDIDPYWDMFECKELDRAPEWDGHTPDDAIARIATLGDADATVGRQLDARLSNCTNGERTSDELGRGTCRVMTIGEFNGEGTEYYDVCSNCGYEFDDDPLNYCPNCGRRLVVDE